MAVSNNGYSNFPNKPRKNLLSAYFTSQWEYIFLIIPGIVYLILFCYIPMYGAVIAFKNFQFGDTIFSASWVGLRWFKEFLGSMYLFRLIKNTLLLNVYGLVFGFPVPIIFALVLNEIRREKFKRVIQTVSYMPYFISTVVVVGMIYNFVSLNHGLINNLLESAGHERINFLMESGYFRPVYIISGIWQGFGWGSIIYFAAMSSIDIQLYEAAIIDGANRLKQIWYITIPGIMPTIIILLILNIGNMLNVGFEKIILLYNPQTYDVADVISTFVYRKGLLEMNYSYSTAVGLFNSVLNFALLVSANAISRKYSETSLW